MSENSDESIETDNPKTEKPKKQRFGKRAKLAVVVVLALLLVPLSYAGYIYAASPAVIRNPKLEHYHFRMDLLVDGKAVDFSGKPYQTKYAKDSCGALLPKQPIHFHDNMNQFTHIHWEGMTGGMVMKYYGWNYIGGINNALGYKLNDLKKIEKVPTFGNYLPAVPKDSQFYVYSGDENNYKERSFDDWKNQDLEQFFGKTSNLPAHEINKGKTSLLDKVFPKAYAHGTDSDADGPDGNETEQEQRERINNLVGSVVIFVQKDKPTDQQIKDRFKQLEPLSDSVCAG